MSDSLRPHDCSTPSSRPCPALSPRVCSNSHPLSQWCYLTSHPLLPLSPFSSNLSQQQGLFQWVGSLHQVAKKTVCQISEQNPPNHGLDCRRQDDKCTAKHRALTSTKKKESLLTKNTRLDLANNLTRGKICNCIHSCTLLSIWGTIGALPKWPWAYCTNLFLWHWNILLLNVMASVCKCMWQCIFPGTYSSFCLYLNFKIPIIWTSVFFSK